MKQVRVYRLEVVYPEGSREPGWRPACWSQDSAFLASLDRKQRRELKHRQFRWPRERMFLSSSSAYGRANLLGWYGADAWVAGSLPVEWPNTDNWAAGEGWEHGDTAVRWYPDMEYVAECQRKALAEEIRTGALPVEDAYEILGELEMRILVREQALGQLAAYRTLLPEEPR
jgi:hypothetical protein